MRCDRLLLRPSSCSFLSPSSSSFLVLFLQCWMGPWAMHTLGKCPSTEFQPQPLGFFRPCSQLASPWCSSRHCTASVLELAPYVVPSFVIRKQSVTQDQLCESVIQTAPALLPLPSTLSEAHGLWQPARCQGQWVFHICLSPLL